MQNQLISCRFFTTMGHFVALLLLFTIVENNIQASLPDNYTEKSRIEATQTANSALGFGIICFFLDFMGIFTGTSLFNNTVNLIQICCHFIGSILLCWVITNVWHYSSIWPIIICTNLTTALAEVFVLLGIHVFKVVLK
mmetsp:Transcript_11121/g.16765  ORF Transcript_11121/g.16765 Transcript_11121/m.16765 type:complete len:139 (+) Transcript_11121:24-440(+)